MTMVSRQRTGSKIIHWNNSYLRDSEGNIVGILSSGSDVTEERLTTMKLQASESKFRALLKMLPMLY